MEGAVAVSCGSELMELSGALNRVDQISLGVD